MKAQAALVIASRRLADAGIEGASGDARRLLAFAMGLAPERLTLALQDDLTPDAEAAFEAAITARLTRQPVSQITGTRLFWGREFNVTRDTLDPRPETEILVETALENPFVRVLDLGTGTGCILISLLKGMPFATGIGADLSDAALRVATENAERHGLGRRASFARSDWYSDITGRFDLIVSNPPYIALDEMAGLSRDVRDWEPHLALTPGGDGLDAYRQIVRGAGSRLMPGGRILLEIGPTQAAAVSEMLRAEGLIGITVRQDLDGRDRVVLAFKPIDETGCGSL